MHLIDFEGACRLDDTQALPWSSQCPAALRPRRRNVYLLTGIGVAVAALAGFFLLPRATGGKAGKSIAVLRSTT